MKIKLDFVTNSSSTCYIVIIPPGLKQLESLDGIKYWDEDGHEEDEALELLNNIITELKNGEIIYRGDHQLFWPIQKYLEDKGLILTSVDSAGGDGVDIIEPISINQLQSALDKVKKYED